ncbi:LuxR C-terminal-related transcriptional regulator [Streptomyces sp. NPDC058424]|uniref:LuxR C-terminal-related transcriptional regulator n=1 Tax=Streptomyces sp. NPDC058424 TaxID=3346491 RepID=UPI0036533C95
MSRGRPLARRPHCCHEGPCPQQTTLPQPHGGERRRVVVACTGLGWGKSSPLSLLVQKVGDVDEWDRRRVPSVRVDVELLCAGADELVISERSARTHVSYVLRKLRLTSRTQAALFASRAWYGAAVRFRSHAALCERRAGPSPSPARSSPSALSSSLSSRAAVRRPMPLAVSPNLGGHEGLRQSS